LKAKVEVSNIAIALWTIAVQQGVLSKTDHVGRARLFYTWIACSLQYNEEILKFKDQDATRSIDVSISQISLATLLSCVVYFIRFSTDMRRSRFSQQALESVRTTLYYLQTCSMPSPRIMPWI
jgi:hypothetical protein